MAKLPKNKIKKTGRSFGEKHKEKFAAILDKNFAYDEQFVFGDRTVGYYCRPSCGKYTDPSGIRKNRDNFSWFDSGEEAQALGYKPCGRCIDTRPPSQRHLVIKRITLEYYRDNKKKATWKKIEGALEKQNFKGTNYHLCREFKSKEGLSLQRWFKSIRESGNIDEKIQKIKDEIENGASEVRDDAMADTNATSADVSTPPSDEDMDIYWSGSEQGLFCERENTPLENRMTTLSCGIEIDPSLSLQAELEAAVKKGEEPGSTDVTTSPQNITARGLHLLQPVDFSGECGLGTGQVSHDNFFSIQDTSMSITDVTFRFDNVGEQSRIDEGTNFPPQLKLVTQQDEKVNHMNLGMQMDIFDMNHQTDSDSNVYLDMDIESPDSSASSLEPPAQEKITHSLCGGAGNHTSADDIANLFPDEEEAADTFMMDIMNNSDDDISTNGNLYQKFYFGPQEEYDADFVPRPPESFEQ